MKKTLATIIRENKEDNARLAIEAFNLGTDDVLELMVQEKIIDKKTSKLIASKVTL